MSAPPAATLQVLDPSKVEPSANNGAGLADSIHSDSELEKRVADKLSGLESAESNSLGLDIEGCLKAWEPDFVSVLGDAKLVVSKSLSNEELDKKLKTLGTEKPTSDLRIDNYSADTEARIFGDFTAAKLVSSDSLSGQEIENRLRILEADDVVDLAIEDFLVKSEKKWFDRFRNAKF